MPVAPPPMPHAEQKRYEALGAKLRDQQVDTLRGYAKTWASTIGTLVGVSSVVTLLSARDTLVKLPATAQILIALALAASLVLAVLAVDRAVRAQIGDLERIGTDPRSIRTYTETEPGAIAAAVKLSRGCAYLSLSALVFALYGLWYATAQLPPPAAQSYLYARGAAPAVICGVLGVDTSGAITLRPAPPLPGEPITDLAKLTPVPRCPAAP